MQAQGAANPDEGHSVHTGATSHKRTGRSTRLHKEDRCARFLRVVSGPALPSDNRRAEARSLRAGQAVAAALLAPVVAPASTGFSVCHHEEANKGAGVAHGVGEGGREAGREAWVWVHGPSPSGTHDKVAVS